MEMNNSGTGTGCAKAVQDIKGGKWERKAEQENEPGGQAGFIVGKMQNTLY